MPKISLTDRVKKAGSLTVRACSHAEAWLTYEERGTQYHRAVQLFPFVQMDGHAHRVATIVEMWAMLDPVDKGTFSIPVLADDLAAEGRLTPDRAVAIRSALAKPAGSRKLQLLRHTVVAHRNAKISFDEQFSKQRLSPNEVREVTSAMVLAANELLASVGLAQVDVAAIHAIAGEVRASLNQLAAFKSS